MEYKVYLLKIMKVKNEIGVFIGVSTNLENMGPKEVW